MTREPSEIESRLDGYGARLRELEARIAALETGAARHAAAARPIPDTAASPETAGISVVATLSLVGRLLVVLGGAFLLRAVTEAGTVPQSVGTAAGLAYALLWLLMADHAAGRLRQTSAAFHGLAGVLIAFPLIAEATLKFRFLSPGWGAVALCATFLLGLAVAWRRTLLGFAWVITFATGVAAVGLAFGSRTYFPFVGSLLLLGAVTLATSYTRGWTLLAGFAAAIADLMVLLVTIALAVATRPANPNVLSATGVLFLQAGLVAIYLGGCGARSLIRRHDLSGFESVQMALACGIGFGGAVAIVHATGRFGPLVGAVALALAAGGYAVSFTFIDRQRGRRTNFLFYSTLALVLTLVGLNASFTGAARAVACAGASLATAWIGNRRQRATLSGHGAFYAVAAGIGCGLLPESTAAFLSADFAPVRWTTAPVLFVLAVTGVDCWLEVAKHGRTWGRLSLVPKLVVLCSLCLGVGGILVTLVAAIAQVGQGEVVDAQALSAIRTGVLAASALVLATLCRARRFAEAYWVVYPLLVVAGIKLLAADLRHGRPVTVFASLVLYGIALIVAPRLARRRSPEVRALEPRVRETE